MFAKIWKKVGDHEIFGLRHLLDSFNSYDAQRVAKIGPDRAAAEWVVRCDGKIRFNQSDQIFRNYNDMIEFFDELDREGGSSDYHVVAIDATDSTISGNGCQHLIGLKNLVELKFVRCNSLRENGLKFVADGVATTLEKLQIESCPKISGIGLRYLTQMSALKSLTLSDLKGVGEPEKIKKELETALPNCHINYQTQ